jgi:hypothetical protein
MVHPPFTYNLEEIEEYIFKGIHYTIPQDVANVIANLAKQVGAPDYVKTPTFQKPSHGNAHIHIQDNVEEFGNGKDKKRKNQRPPVKTFQSTKIANETEFDIIRSCINKITDKNYNDMRNKIMECLENSMNSNLNTNTNLNEISSNIFNIASANRYYSKIYAELYSELYNHFEFIREKFNEHFSKFNELFHSIEYVDPNENYDKFCEINKINEKRKSIATFYMNLMYFNVIHKTHIIQIARNLLENVYEYISLENKKNEVDEFTEIILILCNKEILCDDIIRNYSIKGLTISDIIQKIAKSKTTDYTSLTSKTIFKFMDISELL